MSLRNQFITWFFMANILWFVILVSLQNKGEELGITIQGAFCGDLIVDWNVNKTSGASKGDDDYYICGASQINPLSLMFLFFYAVLILIQFICLLFHLLG